MCRPARHLFTLGSAVSLLLFAVVCVLWARSYRAADMAGYHHARWELFLHSGNGHLAVMGGRTYAGPGALEFPVGWRVGTAPAPDVEDDAIANAAYRRFARWGFAYDPGGVVAYQDGRGRTVRYDTGQRLYVPHWLLLLPASCVIARWVWRDRRARRRAAAGRCPSCGYDLRASPGRCPECGGAVTT